MNSVTLSQWQFAITSVYHFFFVPLTLDYPSLWQLWNRFMYVLAVMYTSGWPGFGESYS